MIRSAVKQRAPPLLHLIGGHEQVATVVDNLYRKILADPRLAPFFAGIDMARQRSHMLRYLVAALDIDPFDAELLRRAHRRQVMASGLGDEEFDRIKALITETLSETNLGTEIVAEVGDIIESMRNDVLNRQPPASLQLFVRHHLAQPAIELQRRAVDRKQQQRKADVPAQERERIDAIAPLDTEVQPGEG